MSIMIISKAGTVKFSVALERKNIADKLHYKHGLLLYPILPGVSTRGSSNESITVCQKVAFKSILHLLFLGMDKFKHS